MAFHTGGSAVIICVAANPSIDKLFEVERLEPDGIHRPTGFVQTAGGKGFNVARAAHTLGADVRAAGMLRGHAGQWVQEALQREGIGGAFVWTDGETRSSLSVASRESAGLTEFYEHGSVVSAAAWVELMEAVGTLFMPGRWLTISGSLPRGAPEDGYHHLVVAAHAAQMRVALDTDGERLRLALPAGPDIVKVNASEVSEMLGVPAVHRDGALAAAARVREMAGGEGHGGVVTRGAEGVVVAAPDGTLYEGAPYERGRYPVGSGDAFLAGLVVGLERSWEWPSALRLALGTATANAEVPGAGKLDPARATELADRAEIREL
jgi:1-phosphofructokinase family hexose kinase